MPKLITVVTPAYRCEKYLAAYFENMLALTNLDAIHIILALNEPTEEERRIADGYAGRYPGLFRVVYVPERESIGASVNRGFRMATTPYLAIADVDDVRMPDCYERQLQTLEKHPEADYTYGDFIAVARLGATEGKRVVVQPFTVAEFTRGSHVGPNHFFRRTLLERAGYWDEQLRSGGDFDFQVRAAFNARMCKTEGVLLYYTDSKSGASAGELQPIERTVIELRYGAWDKIDFAYLDRALDYNINHIKQGDRWVHVRELIPAYDAFMAQKRALIKPRARQSLLQAASLPIRRRLRGPARRFRSWFYAGAKG